MPVPAFDRHHLLEQLRAAAGPPATARDLARQLAIPREVQATFRRELKALVADGALVVVRGNRYTLPDRVHDVTGLRGIGEHAAPPGLEHGAHVTRQAVPPAVVFHRRHGIGPRGTVRHARPRANHAQVVADDIRNGEGDDRAGTRRGEASALHARQVFAYGVERGDVGAPLHHVSDGLLFHGKRHTVDWRGHEGARATRQQAHETAAGRHASRKFEGQARPLLTAWRGERMPAFDERRGERPRRRTMRADDEAARDGPGRRRGEGLEHPRRCLPHRDDVDARVASRPRPPDGVGHPRHEHSWRHGVDTAHGDGKCVGATTAAQRG